MPSLIHGDYVLWILARANIYLIIRNEQEDSLITDTAEDSKEFYCPFELPQDEYGELMFERRLAMEGTASPDPSTHAGSRRGSTVADTDGAYIISLPWLSTGCWGKHTNRNRFISYRTSLFPRAITRTEVRSWRASSGTRDAFVASSCRGRTAGEGFRTCGGRSGFWRGDRRK